MIDLAPPNLQRPGEVTINPWSMQSLGVSLLVASANSQNFVAANRAVFVPFAVPEPVVITKIGWANGAAVAGNLDVGIYSESGALLVSSGSTAQVTVSVPQPVDVTDTLLVRGRYYLALASDTSGATQKVWAAVPAAGILQSFGLLQMDTAFPLPSTATFAAYASAFCPMVWAQGYRTIGP